MKFPFKLFQLDGERERERERERDWERERNRERVHNYYQLTLPISSILPKLKFLFFDT